MRFSDSKNHTVMSTTEAVTVGKVSGFVVDAAARRVVAVQLKKTEGDGDTLTWDRIIGFGPDAVTVESAASITVADERIEALAGKKLAILGKRVLTDAGVELGDVTDVDFDTVDGTVRTVFTKTDEVAGNRLIGLGSYALVVSA